jgi:drug/metabolite transporter (DMT)-like permease
MLIAAAIAWGLATPIIRGTISYVPPLTFLMIRFWISAIITLPLGIYFLRKIKLNKERIIKIFKASTIGHILALILIFAGLEKTHAVDGAIITMLSPIIISIMAFFILKEHITKKEIKGTLIAALGAIIIILEPLASRSIDFGEARISLIGNGLFFLGILADAFYTIYVKKNLAEDKIVTPLVQITFSFLFAAVVLTPIGLSEQFGQYIRTESGMLRTCNNVDIDKYNYSKGTICTQKGCYPTNQSEKYFCLNEEYKTSFFSYFKHNLQEYTQGYALLGVLYMALISGILAYLLYNIGLKHIEASEASVFYYLQPVIGIPASIMLLNEPYSYIMLLGCLIIISGVYIVEKR